MRFFRKNNDKTERKHPKGFLPLAALALSVTAVMVGMIVIASSGTKANYKQRRPVQSVPVTITVNADLAEKLEVKEHVAERQASGEYVLGSDFTTANTYHLMPGVDIPKDPKVYVTGKTEIPAYLYIEVVDNTGIVYSYQIDSRWTELTNVSGKHDGRVFVYQNRSITDADTEQGTLTVGILKDNRITASPDLDLTSDYEDATLTFYAYMAQAADSKTAEQIFSSQLATP